LNGGIDRNTNTTIISSEQLNFITSGHNIESPSTAETSTIVYGAGWERLSVFGHDFIQHTGAGPGVSTQIVAALEDGFGIVALTNADEKAESLEKIILGLAQKALGLGVGNSFNTPPANNSVTSRSILPRYAPSYPDPAGTYYSAGYGTLVLCSVHSSSPACNGVQNDVRAANGSLSPNSPDLFTYWGAVWDKHGYFAYTNGSSYSLLIGMIYPQGYGKNSTPFGTLGTYATAKFEVENGEVVGFGFNDTEIYSLPVTPGGSVKETSQVWFDKKD